MDLYIGWLYTFIRMNKLCMQLNKIIYSLFTWSLKNMFKHFLYNFIIKKKKYVYVFYSIALKWTPLSQNAGSAPPVIIYNRRPVSSPTTLILVASRITLHHIQNECKNKSTLFASKPQKSESHLLTPLQTWLFHLWFNINDCMSV